MLRRIFHCIFLTLALLSTHQIMAQNHAAGVWEGTITAGVQSIDLVLTITETGDGLITQLNIPLQGLVDMQARSTTVDGDEINVEFPALGATFTGLINDDASQIDGDWKQSGQTFNLDLARTDRTTTFSRPQEPVPPFPYQSVDVAFQSAGDTSITLAGTLTIPEGDGPFQAVLLVSGSGAQNRNSELLGHKPFLVLADALSRKGIAVLRYDDRGTAESTGNFRTSTSLDFAEDAKGGIQFLRDQPYFDVTQTGLIGHSEGGIIGQILAAEPDVLDFVVLMAAPAVPGRELMVLQNFLASKTSGSSETEAAFDSTFARSAYTLITPAPEPINYDSLKKVMSVYYSGARDRLAQQYGTFEQFYFIQSTSLSSPWFRTFLNLDPGTYADSITCPVLAVNGSLDIQVSADQNLGALQARLADRHPDNRFEELEGLNHLFQRAITGGVEEYPRIEETINEAALNLIISWIQSLDQKR